MSQTGMGNVFGSIGEASGIRAGTHNKTHLFNKHLSKTYKIYSFNAGNFCDSFFFAVKFANDHLLPAQFLKPNPQVDDISLPLHTNLKSKLNKNIPKKGCIPEMRQKITIWLDGFSQTEEKVRAKIF